MLNAKVFRVLSDGDKIPPGALRFTVRLLADYDLTRFRAVNLRNSEKQFGCARQSAAAHLRRLVKEGILEPGPVTKLGATYRLAEAARVTAEEMALWAREAADRRQRLEVLPEPIPEDPQARRAWLWVVS